MMLHRSTKLAILFVGAWLLAACTSAAPTGSADPLAARGGLPNPVGPSVPREIGPSESVALAYDPADGSLLKADRDGLFRWRADSGWQAIDTPHTYGLSGVVINPDQPTTMYASGPELGVLRSDDGGATWRVINNGLPSLDVTALALHSFRRETLYVWLRDEGIYRTEDGGLSWKRVPDQGPPDTDVRSLTHSTLPGSMNTGRLYAATPTGAYLSMDCF